MGNGSHLAHASIFRQRPEGAVRSTHSPRQRRGVSLDANDVSYEDNANTGYSGAGKQLGCEELLC